MKTKIDLHIHTNYSDGTDSLKKVLELAYTNELQYISITDHESMEAYKNTELLNNYKFTVIPGVELHTFFQGLEIHLLGYGLDYENPDLSVYLKKLRISRSELAYETVKNIQKKGYDVQWEDVVKIAGSDVAITKAHVISALSKFNINSREFYYNFFNPSGAHYLAYKENLLSEAVDIVTSNGGKAILAHPGLIMDDMLVEDVIKYYGTGLEVYYYYYGKYRDSWIKKYETMASNYGIISTGGSDYHGHITESELGGIYVPELVIEKILA